MSAVQLVNPNADLIGKNQALAVNISAAKSLQQILKTNLGPRGTLKMLVGGAGDIKLTKDGNVLLHEMQIQHPTAALIARTATAQDDITGDGTTSNVLFTGELLKQAERFLGEGVHPRILVDGFELARDKTAKFIEEFKVPCPEPSRELLINVARTSLRTKVDQELADSLTESVVDGILCIRQPKKEQIDIHMVEIMTMQHKSAMDTKLIKGLVLDHGARHPDMPKRQENCFIMILNVSLEYEKTEINSNTYWTNAEQKQAMVAAERKFVDDKVKKIIELKRKVCKDKEGFIIVNQKGIDPVALEMLCKENIVGIRRAKRRNMERLALSCGGYNVNSVDDLTPDCLGHAGLVYEHTLGDDKFTFIEDVKNPMSCTILIKGPSKHTIQQIKDAVNDGLRATINAIEDKSVMPGGGAFEVAAHIMLQKWKSSPEFEKALVNTTSRAKLGVQAFADALLIIPKTLAANSGLDAQDAVIELMDQAVKGRVVGLDLVTGKCMIPEQAGVWDNYRVKRQFLQLGTIIAEKLLQVDEVIRAGKSMGKNAEAERGD